MGHTSRIVAGTTQPQVEVLKWELFQVHQTTVCDVAATVQIKVLKWELFEVHQTIVRDVFATLQIEVLK